MSQPKETPPASATGGADQNNIVFPKPSGGATSSQPQNKSFQAFQNIPAELRERPQWVCWRLEQVKGRQTKVPYNPATGRHASVDKLETWSTFQAACSAVATKGMTGIGFVLTDSDPYVGIDIDDKRESPASDAERDVHTSILATVNSYTERSPGDRWVDAAGNERGGYHIIVRGRIDGGRDRGHVGLYSSGRYLTFTGAVTRNAPINDCQGLLDNMVSRMPGTQDAGVPLVEVEPEHSDDELDYRARHADNGAKYQQLYAGDWEAMGYDSQSEADMALMALLAFYSDSNEQCRQMFKASGLYRPKKTTRKYMDDMLGKLRAEQAKRRAEDAAFMVEFRENAAGMIARAIAKMHVKTRADRWLVPTSELRNEHKAVAWLIKHWLQADALIMVHGPSGAGKTFLVIDWCMRIATGILDWLGKPVKPGGVVYLAGEGHTGLRQRLQAWAVYNGTTEQAENMVMSRSGCDLDKPEVLADVIKQIEDSGIKPRLIVVDTLHRFMRGDENLAKDAGLMVANCDALKQKFGCSVLLVHHTGNSAEAQHRARGSSAWRGALDIEIGVQPPPPESDGNILVSLLKTRDADPVPPVCVKLRRVDLPGRVDEDGEQVSSAVLVEGETFERSRSPLPVEEKTQQWRSAWLAYGSTFPRGEHLVPYLARASLKEWLEKNTQLTENTIASYLKPSTKAGAIGMLLEQGWLEAHSDGWVCLNDADSSAMMVMRNAGIGRAKAGAK